jgi:hypothetical protein
VASRAVSPENHPLDSAKTHIYFVQSIESRFARDNELALKFAIDATYEQGLGIVTIASWMVDWLWHTHGVRAELARNGLNKQVFSREGPRISFTRANGLCILVEGATDVAFKNVPDTVAACASAALGDIWLLTVSDISTFTDVRRVFSHVSMEHAARIYRSADVLVKLSLVEGMFGPPLEMFACGGTSIVFDVTGHDEYIQHGKNGIVVPTGCYQNVASWLKILNSHPEFLATLRKNALATADEWPTWTLSSAQFYRALSHAADSTHVTRAELRTRTQRLWALYQASHMQPSAPRIDTEGVRELKQELHEIKESSSWRLTAPLRKAAMRIPALRKSARSLREWGSK